ncbi:YidB family protein [Reyranella sp.]|uniref:YidB family protein n=1 Tax=Reyranella sp. TaxID=1929291 RepID=UPI002730C344|nr:YidB family protein [Reyranella sp.]MDP2377146.1 YidB family protein [Reyranella sp.]
MGLLDIFNGMQNGPRGGRSTGGGMSPIMMALLGLLAYKAVKGFSGSSAPAGGPNAPAPSGGLGDLFKGGGLAGLGAGGLGGLLSGGLGDLIKQFQGAGKAEVADSWVSTGQNRTIEPTDLDQVLTQQQIDFLTTRTGLSKGELLAGLSQQLPAVIDKLTPEGRLPTAEEISRTV